METNYAELTNKKQIFSVKQMVLVGLCSALAYVLMLIHFPVKYLGFLELEFSDIPAIVAGMVYGPLPGVMIEFIKNLIKAVTASTTGGVGELANFIVSLGFVVPVSLLFRNIKGKGRVVLSFGAGVLGMTVVGIIINYFVTVPLYANLFGGMENVVGSAAKTVPAIKDLGTIVILGITPFNIFKGILMSIVGYGVYKLTWKMMK